MDQDKDQKQQHGKVQPRGAGEDPETVRKQWEFGHDERDDHDDDQRNRGESGGESDEDEDGTDHFKGADKPGGEGGVSEAHLQELSRSCLIEEQELLKPAHQEDKSDDDTDQEIASDRIGFEGDFEIHCMARSTDMDSQKYW